MTNGYEEKNRKGEANVRKREEKKNEEMEVAEKVGGKVSVREGAR